MKMEDSSGTEEPIHHGELVKSMCQVEPIESIHQVEPMESMTQVEPVSHAPQMIAKMKKEVLEK